MHTKWKVDPHILCLNILEVLNTNKSNWIFLTGDKQKSLAAKTCAWIILYAYVICLHIFDASTTVLSKMKNIRIILLWQVSGFNVCPISKTIPMQMPLCEFKKISFIHYFTFVKMKNSRGKNRFFWLAYFSAKNTFQQTSYWESSNYLSWQHTSGIIKKGIQKSLM